MSFLKHRGRVFLELCGVAYAVLMLLVAVIPWVGHYTWRIDPSSFVLVAGVSLMFALYLVLDEIRLNTRK
jgi:hypothetical protein